LTPEQRQEQDRELEVRFTAQRLIGDLLPPSTMDDPPVYNLNLTRATLEYFDLSERVIGDLVARATTLYESNVLSGSQIRGNAWFSNSVSWGRFYAQDTVFGGRAWFSTFTARDRVVFAGARFDGETKFADAVFHGPVSFAGAVAASPPDFATTSFESGAELPDGW